MSDITTLDRIAQTDSPVLEVLAGRWSPRAYDTEAPIDEAKLASALEAARWTPSANNTQPWRFIVARRGTEAHARVHDALLGFNQAWAGTAAVLIVAVAETTNVEGRELPMAVYDLGQAMAHLSVQAHHDGLFVHQMSGFDRDAMRAAFDIDAQFTPVTVAAVGMIGDAGTLPEALQERERAPRVRRPIADSIILSA
jgi:nitroreductase